MTFWQRLSAQPQNLFIRKALFQVHLWVGLAIGLYVVMLSLTGSALVLRAELDAAAQAPRPVFDPAARVLSRDELREAAGRAYPGYTIARMGDPTRVRRRNPVVEIQLPSRNRSARWWTISPNPRRFWGVVRATSSCDGSRYFTSAAGRAAR